ncbi:hypothetical protein AK88_03546 [Plasmodium fragile]|uniref:Uncharacterized protein n=1 Tax=Plasmodium fragile TaxID=5857 RepID=A0A0D9QJ57_PLAFR|nr:uncharacterized protein AK88_03546 [Plasmodium fragile]KJP86837.1 hypothetical protein AK88_03546 [Plasmodium fragile]
MEMSIKCASNNHDYVFVLSLFLYILFDFLIKHRNNSVRTTLLTVLMHMLEHPIMLSKTPGMVYALVQIFVRFSGSHISIKHNLKLSTNGDMLYAYVI